jgi:hypothetical protein
MVVRERTTRNQQTKASDAHFVLAVGGKSKPDGKLMVHFFVTELGIIPARTWLLNVFSKHATAE